MSLMMNGDFEHQEREQAPLPSNNHIFSAQRCLYLYLTLVPHVAQRYLYLTLVPDVSLSSAVMYVAPHTQTLMVSLVHALNACGKSQKSACIGRVQSWPVVCLIRHQLVCLSR